ncbi:hypothetical protein QBC35DRAFT_369947, partial [Podospora australis]
GLFAIHGKAGCGKSILMKFLGDNDSVSNILRRWAGMNTKLVVVKMFFWRSADKLQKSMAGFYRTILFHIIRQCPEFVEILLPYDSDNFRLNVSAFTKVEFRLSELHNAFQRISLVHAGSATTHSFCYSIDGLDEYEGDNVDQKFLAEQIASWCKPLQSDRVKVIVSSRPNTVFRKVFGEDAGDVTMNLHEVTKDDIVAFVQS